MVPLMYSARSLDGCINHIPIAFVMVMAETGSWVFFKLKKKENGFGVFFKMHYISAANEEEIMMTVHCNLY